jgi:hypothetical protein
VSDRDNITLPREVVKLALDAFEAVMPFSTTQRELKIRAVEALRTALAAPEPEPVALAHCPYTPPPSAHFGYVLGDHWLETAYSRVLDGEAEADVLRDCGWERVDEALRRDAERYRYLRNRDPKEVFCKSGKAAGVWIDWEDDMAGLQLLTGDDADAAIDAAMQEDKT